MEGQYKRCIKKEWSEWSRRLTINNVATYSNGGGIFCFKGGQMNLIELSKYLQDEQAAEDYLYAKEILKRFTVCPHCGSDKLGHISRGRIKCYKCKKEWHKRKGSFLEGKHITSSKFIGFLKLYANDYGLTELSSELYLDRKTTIEVQSELQSKLLDKNNISLIDFKKEAIIHIGKSKEIMLSSKEHLPNEVKSYMQLSFTRFKGTGGLYTFLINSKFVGNKKEQQQLNNFMGYTKMRLISFRGIKHDKLLDYLIETIIRFNNRDKLFYNYLVEILSF